jgi:hypothetical protein
MMTNKTARMLGAGILMWLSLATDATAQCSFGSLCNKTISLMFFPVRFCVNGNCVSSPTFAPIAFSYFAPDGTVSTRFGFWWNIPGVSFDTFVCRKSSTKTASRSCDGASCKPDLPLGVLDSVDMTDSCSTTGNEENLTITLNKKIHQFSKAPIFKDQTLDTMLRIEINITNGKDASGNAKCDARIHGSAQLNPAPKRPPDIVSQDYEYDGWLSTPEFTFTCSISDGNTLRDMGPFTGKTIDPGP